MVRTRSEEEILGRAGKELLISLFINNLEMVSAVGIEPTTY